MRHVTGLIDEVLTGRVLSPEDDAAFREHLRGCEACRAQYDQQLALLRVAGGGVAPGELSRATVRAVRLSKAVDATPTPWPWQWLLAGAAVAAALVVMVAAWPRERVGVVLVAGKGFTVDGAPAAKDQVLLEDAVLVTEKDDAAVVLAGEDGKRGVLIRANSRVEVDSSHELTVHSGRIRLQTLKPLGAPLVVRSESLRVVQDTAGVFIVEERPTGTFVAVHQGKVMVRGPRGASAEVGEGQEAEVTETGLGPVRTASANALVEDRGDGTFWGAILRFLRQLVDAIGRALTGD